MNSPILAWVIFLAGVLALLFLDLFVLHRREHEIRVKEALIGVLVPVGLALAFTGVIYAAYEWHAFGLGTAAGKAGAALPGNGKTAAIMYLTGYIVEVSLSADNVFLFVVLMTFFAVPLALQHRVLFWGVLGALVMRGVMIGVGATIISQFHAIIYIFGAFLLFTGVKMFFTSDAEPDPSNHLAVRLARKMFSVTREYRGKAFFVREAIDGRAVRLVATPLFLVLVAVELTDVLFAVDSIPAIFGITQDPFIVFTSNVFAILGLRSMYFLLAGVMDKFRFLKLGLSFVLTFVGVKMLLPAVGGWLDPRATLDQQLPWLFDADDESAWNLKVLVSLAVIVAALAAAVIASLAIPVKHKRSEMEA